MVYGYNVLKCKNINNVIKQYVYYSGFVDHFEIRVSNIKNNMTILSRIWKQKLKYRMKPGMLASIIFESN